MLPYLLSSFITDTGKGLQPSVGWWPRKSPVLPAVIGRVHCLHQLTNEGAVSPLVSEPSGIQFNWVKTKLTFVPGPRVKLLVYGQRVNRAKLSNNNRDLGEWLAQSKAIWASDDSRFSVHLSWTAIHSRQEHGHFFESLWGDGSAK